MQNSRFMYNGHMCKDAIYEKMTNLRSQFAAELSKIEASKKSGAGSRSIFTIQTESSSCCSLLLKCTMLAQRAIVYETTFWHLSRVPSILFSIIAIRPGLYYMLRIRRYPSKFHQIFGIKSNRFDFIQGFVRYSFIIFQYLE